MTAPAERNIDIGSTRLDIQSVDTFFKQPIATPFIYRSSTLFFRRVKIEINP